jgi:hypothetical protein
MNNYLNQFETQFEHTGPIREVLAVHDGNPDEYRNDGAHTYIMALSESTTQMPCDSTHDIVIPLTSPQHDVSEFHKSCYSIDFDVRIAINELLPVPKVYDSDPAHAEIDDGQGGTMPNPDYVRYPYPDGYVSPDGNYPTWNQIFEHVFKAMYIFIGVKNSSEIFDRHQLLFNHKPVANTLNSFSIQSCNALNTVLPKTAKENNGRLHSLWENVVNDSGTYCGFKISYWDLLYGNQGQNVVDRRMLYKDATFTATFTLQLGDSQRYQPPHFFMLKRFVHQCSLALCIENR